MRLRIIALVVGVSLLFTAGVAIASPDEDTLFTFGYDPVAQLFLSNTHDIATSSLDCTLTGELTATYGDAVDDAVPVIDLTDADGGVVLEPNTAELADGVEPAAGPVPYADAFDECGISGVPVGEKGHINHGQIMSLFNHLVDMQGRGCLNRWLAQSELGKGDQQVQHEDFEAVETIGDTGTIDFTTVLADCQHGNAAKGEDHPSNQHNPNKASSESGDGNSHGRPDSPGKSDQAPGKNKNK